jgi:hypothetical protein
MSTARIATGCWTILCGLAIAAAVIADPASPPAPPPMPGAAVAIAGPPELIARGEAAQRALAPLKQGLMSTLKAALAESPESAVAACQLAAPGIAANASDDVYTVGRTSDRLRNPKNAPAPWMQALLDQYAQSPLEGPDAQTGTVVALADGAIGYVEPIRIQPLCTTCHGAAVDPELLAEIRSRYPDDQAIGYAPGDFRGLFWVVAKPAP